MRPTGTSPSRARSGSSPSAWSGWSCVSAIPPGAAARRDRRGDRVEVRRQRRPRVDHPRGVAPDDPRVGAVERVGRRVRRPDEQRLHGLSAGRCGTPGRRARRRRRGPGRPRRTRTGCDASARCCARRARGRRRASPTRPARGRSRRTRSGRGARAATRSRTTTPPVIEQLPSRVRAHDDGLDVAGRRLAGRVPRAALERAPAEVRAAARAAAHEVDLLPLALADVADRQVAGLRSNEKRQGLRRP